MEGESRPGEDTILTRAAVLQVLVRNDDGASFDCRVGR